MFNKLFGKKVISSVQQVAFFHERIRNARHTALFRATMVSLFFANNLFMMQYVLQRPWQSTQSVMVLYVALAWIILIAARRSNRVAIASSLAIPFLDMPIVFFLLQLGVASLTAADPGTPYSMGQTLTAVFAIFIVLSMFSLKAWHIVLAAVVGMLFSVLYAIDHDLPMVTLGFSIILLGCVAVACIYARHRIIVLVTETADHQVRRDRMRRFFSPQVALAVEELEDTAEGVTKEVTVLVSDLRDFTALSNRLSSEEVVDLLNDYLSIMVEQIFAHGGTLDKFMGDGILAYFGAPLDQPDHAERAVSCALAMQQALTVYNQQLNEEGKQELRMGIGLQTGKVTLGAIGSPSRKEFTIIGETVNLASRLEGLTKEYRTDILLSEATRELLDGAVEVESLPLASVRGIDQPVPVYQPLGARSDSNLAD